MTKGYNSHFTGEDMKTRKGNAVLSDCQRRRCGRGSTTWRCLTPCPGSSHMKNQSQREYLTCQGPWLGKWASFQVAKLTFTPFCLAFGGLWRWLRPHLDPLWRCWEPRPAQPFLWSFQELHSWIGSTTLRPHSGSGALTSGHASEPSDSLAPFGVA